MGKKNVLFSTKKTGLISETVKDTVKVINRKLLIKSGILDLNYIKNHRP